MKMFFTKMHGCGNDYIYFDCRDSNFPDPSGYARQLSDRHFSIGGDGLVLIERSDIADAKMRMFNADGSEASMCGNAIRCVGKYLYEKDLRPRQSMTIETLSGNKSITVFSEGGVVKSAKVDMGKAVLFSPDGLEDSPQRASFSIPILGKHYRVTCVSIGNPHCVLFCEEVDSLNLSALGPQFERHPLFPSGINTEFVEPLSDRVLKVRVWERGSGETLACGTGACAAVAAAVYHGICLKNQDITVSLPGGELIIHYTDEAIYMTGPADLSFAGEVELPNV